MALGSENLHLREAAFSVPQALREVLDSLLIVQKKKRPWALLHLSRKIRLIIELFSQPTVNRKFIDFTV